MLALTVQQPWATLIAHGPKRWENRQWEPRPDEGPPLYPGDYLALHAGREVSPESWWDALELAEAHGILDTLPLLAGFRKRVNLTAGYGRVQLVRAHRKKYMTEACPYGAIVAVVTFHGVDEVVPGAVSDDPWKQGPLAWRLGHVTPIAPVPCPGHPKLWTLPPHVLAAVTDAWKEAVAVESSPPRPGPERTGLTPT